MLKANVLYKTNILGGKLIFLGEISATQADQYMYKHFIGYQYGHCSGHTHNQSLHHQLQYHCLMPQQRTFL